MSPEDAYAALQALPQFVTVLCEVENESPEEALLHAPSGQVVRVMSMRTRKPGFIIKETKTPALAVQNITTPSRVYARHAVFLVGDSLVKYVESMKRESVKG